MQVATQLGVLDGLSSAFVVSAPAFSVSVIAVKLSGGACAMDAASGAAPAAS